MENYKVILASQSPRRKEILKMLFEDFEIIVADCDESLEENMGARQAVEYLSLIKNRAVSGNFTENHLVISADTVVAVDNRILGKPHSKEDAREMLSLLSGKTHQVYTGVTLFLNGREKTFSTVTDVVFHHITDNEIEDYISTNEPYDKAGGYAIQGKAGLYIKSINGDYYNVVGLPIAEVKRQIEIGL